LSIEVSSPGTVASSENFGPKADELMRLAAASTWA
jgi:hypothetical protein